MIMMPRRLTRILRISCFLSLALMTNAAEPIVIGSRNAPARDHVLFVGTELMVRQEDGIVPVRRVEGRSVELADGSGKVVPVRLTSGLQLRPATKVSTTQLQIDDLKVERCFSPAADPHREQMRNQMALQHYMADRMEAAEQGLRDAARPPDPNSQGGDAASAAPVDASELALAELTSVMDLTSRGNTLTANSDRPMSRRQEALDFDALRLECTMSAPESLRDVQAVVVVRLSKEGEFSDISFPVTIGNVGTSPRRVSIMQAGIPPGYTVKDTRLHLFVQTEEFPSNLSEKRYAVTADEAREYLRLVHMDRYRGESAPAEPAWSLMPASLLDREDGHDLDFPVTVDLDERGQIVRVHDERAVIPAQVREALSQMVFMPALREGVAVASTLTVNLAEFYR